MTTTITFGELDRESCADVDIINDNIGNEAPEVFEVNLFVSEQNKDGIKIVNPITIIDDDTGMQGKIIKVIARMTKEHCLILIFYMHNYN